MADFPAQARVVIIGGGAVGASALYHLAKAGWTDARAAGKERADGRVHLACGGERADLFVQLVDHEHAALFGAASTGGWARRSDYPMNYHVTGSVRLGHTMERLQEFQRVVGMGRYQGMDLDILAPDEIALALSVPGDA